MVVGKMSDEADCLSAQTVFKMKKKPSVLKTIRYLGGIERRAMVDVVVGELSYWADKKTGSLYCKETGRCLTGAITIVE